ncbi:hypothetical protein B0T20DRAFT_405031 [Sordaria brevicollis]|uniref:Uncharacterized protein n=1 Tax=Sordaria brevicollis TaxID=83679 RepID=A0AAE0UE25_SORBR|nr:hypothetical protein B0T20DRAFT_405031 [Sordaria brevicollis]
MGSALSKRGSSKKSSGQSSSKSSKRSGKEPAKEPHVKVPKQSAAGISSSKNLKGEPQKEEYIIKLGLICKLSLDSSRDEPHCTWHNRFAYRWTSVDEAFLRNPDNAHIAKMIRERAHELEDNGMFELRGVFCLAPQAAIDALNLYIKKTDTALSFKPTRTGNLGTLMEQLEQGKLRNVEFLPAPSSD